MAEFKESISACVTAICVLNKFVCLYHAAFAKQITAGQFPTLLNHMVCTYDSNMHSRTHGGKRQNSGRKTELGAGKTKKITVTVDDLTHRRLKVVGVGNVSLGVRLCSEHTFAAYQKD